MIDLIILGLVLFIVGVGATIIYDKHKEKLAAQPIISKPVTKRKAAPKTRKDKRVSTMSKMLDEAEKTARLKYKKLNPQEIEMSFEEAFLEAVGHKPDEDETSTTVTAEDLRKQLQRIRDRK